MKFKSQMDIKIKEYTDMIRGTLYFMRSTGMKFNHARSLREKLKSYQSIRNRLVNLKKQGQNFPPSEYDS